MANTDRMIQALDKQKKALELRKAGVSYVDIANTLGYKTSSGAHNAVKKMLRRTVQEVADDVRRLEVARLDALILAIWSDAAKGDDSKIDRVLKIMQRRADLLGLDAPKRQDVTSAGAPLAVNIYIPDNGRQKDDNDVDSSQ